MPSMTPQIHEQMIASHLYTVTELANTTPTRLVAVLSIPEEKASDLIGEAVDVLVFSGGDLTAGSLSGGCLSPKKQEPGQGDKENSRKPGSTISHRSVMLILPC